MYGDLGISKEVLEYGARIEAALEDRFTEIDGNAEYNQLKVIAAMQKNRVSDIHFSGTTGYGYNDLGRETLEQVYADVFHTEDALVRPQIVCGTHALYTALAGNLRPGDELLSPVGKPYDTLEEVIGIRESNGSLREYGISYRQVDLLPDGHVGLHGHGPLSRRRQFLHQRVSTVLPFPIVDADGVARRCQLPHRGASDAAGGARHQCDLFHVAPSPCVVLPPV